MEKVRVDNYGQLDITHLNEILDEKTALVSVIFGNNEIGTISPIADISAICHKRGIPFHTDAVQAAAHLNIDIQKIDADLLSISAHKFYGPKGVGALIKKKSMDLIPQITGGKQEGDFRAGTHNVTGIVGLAKALELQIDSNKTESIRLSNLRDLLIDGTLDMIPDCQLTGHPTNRLPNHASFVFSGIEGNELLLTLDMAGFAVSSGSACKVGNPSPSEVLLALGINKQLAMGSLRVTLGKMTTEKHIEKFLGTLPKVIEKLRHRKGK
jgi:cysteine desulfurase